MPDDNTRARKRMVVEEVSPTSSEPVLDTQPIEEIKEKVEELQDITEHISEDVKESAEVQEEIVEATEKVEPAVYVSPTPQQPSVMEPMYPGNHSTGPNPLIIIIPGVLLLGALLGGIVFYQKSISNVGQTPSPTEAPIASSAPSATPNTKVDLTKYTVNIFNGSGIPGEAGKAKDLLTTAGFKVGTTGNAATYDFTKTVIKTKDTVDTAFIAKLSETLGKTYVVDKAQVLDSSSKNDVEVFIGSTKASN